MLVFGLQRFKGGEGKYLTVTDHSGARVPVVVGVLCSASGQPQQSRSDPDLEIRFQVEVRNASRLTPMNPESAEWLKAFVARTI